MTEITTIKMTKKTKARLHKLKESDRESYEEILVKMLSIMNILKNDSLKAQQLLQEIDSNIERKKLLSK